MICSEGDVCEKLLVKIMVIFVVTFFFFIFYLFLVYICTKLQVIITKVKF